MREVVFVDGVRTPFGRAGDNGIYAGTRADDLMVNQLARQFEEDPDVRSGITTLCIGLGMGATVILGEPASCHLQRQPPRRTS